MVILFSGHVPVLLVPLSNGRYSNSKLPIMAAVLTMSWSDRNAVAAHPASCLKGQGSVLVTPNGLQLTTRLQRRWMVRKWIFRLRNQLHF